MLKMLSNNRGCFGGGGSKAPEIKQAPPPAPAPTIVQPTEVSAQTVDERRSRLRRLRQGFMSTIKTSQRGITGSAADLVASKQTGKTKLGE